MQYTFPDKYLGGAYTGIEYFPLGIPTSKPQTELFIEFQIKYNF